MQSIHLDASSLNSLKVEQLKELCNKRSITGILGLRKQQLIDAILQYDHLALDTSPIIIPTQTFEGQLPTRKPEERDLILRDLIVYGYSVVDVLSAEIVAQLYSQVWESFESFGTIRRHRPETWLKNWPRNYHGIIKHYGVGWWPVVWKARELLYPFFARLWQDNDLVCSFDGLCLIRPPEISNLLYNNTKSWLHRDQSLDDPSFKSVQCILNLLPCGPEDGGLLLCPELHTCTNAFRRAMPGSQGSFCQFTHEVSSKFRYLKLNMNPGQIALFDSRIPHQNVVPTRGRNLCGRPMDQLFRSVIYVTFFPRSHVSEKGKEIREKIVREGLTTGHYAPEPEPVSLRIDRDRADLPNPPKLTLHDLTSLQRSFL